MRKISFSFFSVQPYLEELPIEGVLFLPLLLLQLHLQLHREELF
jgi:hypothetical protein